MDTWFNYRITLTNEVHLFYIVKENSGLFFWLYGQKTGILFQNNDFVHDAGVFITICLNDIFPGMCDTRLTSYTISLLIMNVDVDFYSIEELNV